MHQDADEVAGDFGFGGIDGVAEHLSHGGVVSGHTGDRRDDGDRAERTEGTLSLSTRDVLAKQLKDRDFERPGVGEAGLVAFQGREEQDAVNAQVFAICLEDPLDDGAEEAFVVVTVHEKLELGETFGDFRGLVMVVENGVVEVLFGGEMAEDNRLVDAGRGGNFLGGGSTEALAREDIEGGFDELAAAIAGRKAVRCCG